MAKIKYTDINKGFWRLSDFGEYDSALTTTQVEYTFGATAAAAFSAYDAQDEPFRVNVTFAHAVFETDVEGRMPARSGR